MPVIKRPTNPLRAAIIGTADRLDAPTLDRTPTEAAIRGFLASLLGGPVADTVAPEAEDAMMQAAMPAMAAEAPAMKVAKLLRNHPKLQEMIDQGYDVSRVLFHGTDADIRAFKPSTAGLRGEGVYTTTNPHRADFFASRMARAGDTESEIGSVIYPMVARGKAVELPRHGGWVPKSELHSDIAMPAGLYDDPKLGRALDRVVKEPERLRSIFAQFDPNKMHLNDLLASILGLGTVGSLAQRDPDQ